MRPSSVVSLAAYTPLAQAGTGIAIAYGAVRFPFHPYESGGPIGCPRISSTRSVYSDSVPQARNWSVSRSQSALTVSCATSPGA